MASRIELSTLSVQITESYELNGVNYGNTMTKSYASNGQVSQRVMNIAAYGGGGTHVWTDILALGTADGQGQVKKTDYKYFRITNLDDTTQLNLRIYNGADYLMFEVGAGSSALFMEPGVDATTASANVTFADIQQVSAQAASSTASVDVEFVVVTA